MLNQHKIPLLDLPEPLLTFVQPWLEVATDGMREQEINHLCAEACARSLQTYHEHLAAGMNEYDAALEAQLALGIPDANGFAWATTPEIRKPSQTLDDWMAIAVVGPDNDLSRQYRNEITEHHSALYDRFKAEGFDAFEASDKAVAELGSPYEAQRRFVKMSASASRPILDVIDLELLREVALPYR